MFNLFQVCVTFWGKCSKDLKINVKIKHFQSEYRFIHDNNRNSFLKLEREVESDVQRKPNDELDHSLPSERKINELMYSSMEYTSILNSDSVP